MLFLGFLLIAIFIVALIAAVIFLVRGIAGKAKKANNNTFFKKAIISLVAGIVALFVGVVFLSKGQTDDGTTKAQETASSKSSTKQAKSSSKKEAASSSSTAAESKKLQADAKKRAENESNELQKMDDYPLLGHYTLHFSGNKVNNVQVWCDESLANASAQDVKHYFSYGVQVGMKALDSTDKSPVVQVYSGSKMIARSAFDNNMTFVDKR